MIANDFAVAAPSGTRSAGVRLCEGFPMAYQVRDDTIRRCGQCPRGFQCRDAKQPRLCPSSTYVEDGILFVKVPEDPLCPYAMQFGDS